MGEAVQWAVGGAIEHGSFMMAFAAMLLTSIAVIFAFGGIFAFLHIRSRSAAIAKETAEKKAEEIAERAANTYLQAELHAIVSEHLELVRDKSTADQSDNIADVEGDRG